MRYLAERGVNVNAANEFGDTPLLDIAALGYDDVAEILLRHGANPNSISRTNDTVLHCAVESGNIRLIGLLLDAGADPHYTTDLGESVLDAVAASKGNSEEILALLSQHGIKQE